MIRANYDISKKMITDVVKILRDERVTNHMKEYFEFSFLDSTEASIEEKVRRFKSKFTYMYY
jgi:hypothetical protein